MIGQDLKHLQFIEDMTLDKRIWMSKDKDRKISR